MKTKKVLKFINDNNGIFKKLDIENEKFKNIEYNNFIIRKSNFYNCKFKKCNVNVEIDNTNFSMCNFKDVKFDGIIDEVISSTSVSNVHFYGCKFKNVSFENFDIDDQVSFDDCDGIYLFNRKGGRFCIAVEYNDCLMVKAGCFWGNLKEFEAASIEKQLFKNEDINPYDNQIKYLKTIEDDLYGKDEVLKA